MIRSITRFIALILCGALAATPALASHFGKADSCCKSCPKPCAKPCVEKACHPVSAKVEVKDTYYQCKTKEFCLKRCPKFSFRFPRLWKKHSCGKCGAACGAYAVECPKCEAPVYQGCEKPRCKKVLIKVVRTTEVDDYDCEPVLVAKPACPKGCPPGCPHGHHGQVAVEEAVEAAETLEMPIE